MPYTQDVLPLHREALVRFAMLQLRDVAHAEDCVQETLLAALQSASQYTGASSIGTWLTGILKHKIADHFRAASRDECPVDAASESNDARSGEAGSDTLVVADDHTRPCEQQFNPEAIWWRNRLLEQIATGLETLPVAAARVFVLRELLGAGTEDVCSELAISANYCSVLHHRARSALRLHLQNQGW